MQWCSQINSYCELCTPQWYESHNCFALVTIVTGRSTHVLGLTSEERVWWHSQSLACCMQSWELITNLCTKKSAVSSCWEFPVLHCLAAFYFLVMCPLCFLQCDWQMEKSPQKVININWKIGWMSPDSRLGSGHELTCTVLADWDSEYHQITNY